ncbi:MAG TPA: DUF4440 domain-containing protein [Gaiellaceae bacterium]|nr:DUF4440 domain-containing protein [Gaiellaceae bacterium]
MEDGACSAAFVEALARRDAAGVAALYALDGTLLTRSADLICGRADIEAYWREGIAFGLAGVELEELGVEVVGALAIELGRYRLVVDGGAAESGKYLVLHRREADGAWRRAVEVYNPEEEQ